MSLAFIFYHLLSAKPEAWSTAAEPPRGVGVALVVKEAIETLGDAQMIPDVIKGNQLNQVEPKVILYHLYFCTKYHEMESTVQAPQPRGEDSHQPSPAVTSHFKAGMMPSVYIQYYVYIYIHIYMYNYVCIYIYVQVYDNLIHVYII